MAYAVGEVWNAQFPYNEDPSKGKQRPVVVIGYSAMGPGQDQVVLVVPVTGYGDGGQAQDGDIALLNWRSLGFQKASWVRARRVWGANPRALKSRFGNASVGDTDMAQILSEVARLFP